MVPPKALIVTQYYRPELIGSAPFCGDIAEWLNRNGRCVTVLTGMPHYPDADAFPEYRNGKRKSEQINGVAVERVQTRVPKRGSVTSRLLSEGLFLLRGIWALGTGRIQRRPLIISLCPTVLSVALGSLARSRGGRHIAIVHDIQSGLAGGL